jgi:alpha-aminoadipate carrier protein LysW
MVECIICGGDLFISPETEPHEIIMCDDCGSELEIITVDPFTVERAPEEEEDWGE